MSQSRIRITDSYLSPPGIPLVVLFLCQHFRGFSWQKLILYDNLVLLFWNTIWSQDKWKNIGSILTYLYTKLKMNALGIIKWNNSIRECHGNERPVDFQVNRNQQQTLFKQIHLIKKEKEMQPSPQAIQNSSSSFHLLTFDLLEVTEAGSGEAKIWT